MRHLLIILSMLVSLAAEASGYDTLRVDSLVQTTGMRVVLKGGTTYKANSKGLVIEGTPANDIDLWSTGPLVFFSSDGVVKWNSHGRVTQGIIAVNMLASCTDNQFREFRKGTRIFFDNDGLVYRGTLNESISITIGDEVVVSSSDSPIEFYSNGNIKHITPSYNFKFTTADGQKITLSAGMPIKLGLDGELLEAVLAKRANAVIDGQPVSLKPGHLIKLDYDGRIVE